MSSCPICGEDATACPVCFGDKTVYAERWTIHNRYVLTDIEALAPVTCYHCNGTGEHVCANPGCNCGCPNCDGKDVRFDNELQMQICGGCREKDGKDEV